MAITGTGTQADPYVVTTWDELVSKAAEFGKYVKLGADIDMNDEYPEGLNSAITINCNEIDGDGKSIKNIKTEANRLISTSNINGICKNLNFTNMLIGGGSNSTTMIYQSDYRGVYKFNHCKFSGRFEGNSSQKSQIVYGYVRFDYCSFNFQLMSNSRILAEHSSKHHIFLYYCNINLTGDTSETLYIILKNSYVKGSLSNATVCAEAQNNSERGLYSVLDVTAPAYTADSLTQLVLANSDKCSNIGQYLTSVTTAQLTNAEYLSSIGFPIET